MKKSRAVGQRAIYVPFPLRPDAQNKEGCISRELTVVLRSGYWQWTMLDESQTALQRLLCNQMLRMLRMPSALAPREIPTTRPWNKNIPGIDRFDMKMIGL
jgi:hypothetical protein